MTVETVGVALLGAGRMGRTHALNLGGMPGVRVVTVADPNPDAAETAGRLTRAETIYAEPEAAIAHPAVDAVLIVTPADTHASLIEAAARAGKAVFCEKPVALDLGETRRVMAVVGQAGVPFQIGFQRRYDPGYLDARRRLDDGEVGRIDQFRAVARDHALPPLDYLAGSGGIFLDQSVHDFDLARFLVGEVVEVSAWGAARIDPRIGELGDVDTAMTLLRFADGALGVVESSRRAVYGYDIRTEVFGEKGRLVVDAVPKTPIQRYGEGGVTVDYCTSFADRFKEAYRLEVGAFVAALREGRPPSPGPVDAVESLRIALAAARSLREARPVKVEEVA